MRVQFNIRIVMTVSVPDYIELRVCCCRYGRTRILHYCTADRPGQVSVRRATIGRKRDRQPSYLGCKDDPIACIQADGTTVGPM